MCAALLHFFIIHHLQNKTASVSFQRLIQNRVTHLFCQLMFACLLEAESKYKIPRPRFILIEN